MTRRMTVCLYAFMRTTVELPPALLRSAKARSAERGETLKAFLTRAVVTELGHDAVPGATQRVTLPLFGCANGPRVHVSNVDLEGALADADVGAGAHRVSRRRRPRR